MLSTEIVTRIGSLCAFGRHSYCEHVGPANKNVAFLFNDLCVYIKNMSDQFEDNFILFDSSKTSFRSQLFIIKFETQ